MSFKKKIQPTTGALILAAGQGKRTHFDLPKTCLPIGSQPLIYYILETLHLHLPSESIGIVIGHQKEIVKETVLKKFPGVRFIEQINPLGTLDAVKCSLQSGFLDLFKKVLVLPGDTPLIPEQMIQKLLLPSNSCVKLLTTVTQNPSGYGRIIRDNIGRVLKIVEEKDATTQEKKIKEVSTGIYAFKTSFLKKNVGFIKNQNAQNEYYLTDLVEFAQQHKTLTTETDSDALYYQGVNDLIQLAHVETFLLDLIRKKHLQNGVRLIEPHSIYIDPRVRIEPNVTIYPRVSLKGPCHIHAKAVIHEGVCLEAAIVGKHTVIKPNTIIENSSIGDYSSIGPLAHIRPECCIGNHVKIGNFVEIKKSTIKDFTKISHLSYLGDATVGEHVNIGCGFITCNYDGKQKHSTIIDHHVFIGSDSQTIAPIHIEAHAYIAAGSTITENVPSHALAIGRSRQINKLNFVKKFVKKS